MIRNPDIRLDTEQIPEGMCLIEGKLLQHTARTHKIPFGVATRWLKSGKQFAHLTVGLIILDEDRERMIEAIENKKPTLVRKKQIS